MASKKIVRNERLTPTLKRYLTTIATVFIAFDKTTKKESHDRKYQASEHSHCRTILKHPTKVETYSSTFISMRSMQTPWTIQLANLTMIVSIVVTPLLANAWAPSGRLLVRKRFRSVRGHTFNENNNAAYTRSRASSYCPTSTALAANDTENLISLQRSLELFGRQDGSERVVFVDGSYYHKGDRNGRDE